MENLVLKSIGVFMLFSCFIVSIYGQALKPKHSILVGDTCESTHKYLEEMRNEAGENKELIFVVSKLNKREKFKLNNTRLLQAKNASAILNIDSKHILFLTGDRVADSNGFLDFYLGSQLYLRVFISNGKNVCLICCDV
jgi:hypothetical protein